MTEFSVVIEKGEDGYLLAEVPELPGCHTQAKKMDELIKRIQEAISLYIKEEAVAQIRTRFIGIQKVEV